MVVQIEIQEVILTKYNPSLYPSVTGDRAAVHT